MVTRAASGTGVFATVFASADAVVLASYLHGGAPVVEGTESTN